MTVRMDDLFRRSTDVQFLGRTLYLRAMSDFDLNAREEHALYVSAAKRKELVTEDSKANLAHLHWIGEATDDAPVWCSLPTISRGRVRPHMTSSVRPATGCEILRCAHRL